MRIAMMFILGIGLACIMRNCQSERYQRICNETCQSQGHEYGSMTDNWNCNCVGRAGKKNGMSRP